MILLKEDFMSNRSPKTDLTNITCSGDLPLPYLGYLLNKAAREVGQQVDASLEPLGIRVKHYIILLLLTQVSSALPQKEIGCRLRIDRNTMVSLIDDLERLALVRRSRDPNDRRSYAISITEKGRELAPQADQIVAEADARFADALTGNELEQLSELLAKLLQGSVNRQ
jgi:DNA-binding MarR family transcriptional regulator